MKYPIVPLVELEKKRKELDAAGEPVWGAAFIYEQGENDRTELEKWLTADHARRSLAVRQGRVRKTPVRYIMAEVKPHQWMWIGYQV